MKAVKLQTMYKIFNCFKDKFTDGGEQFTSLDLRLPFLEYFR